MASESENVAKDIVRALRYLATIREQTLSMLAAADKAFYDLGWIVAEKQERAPLPFFRLYVPRREVAATQSVICLQVQLDVPAPLDEAVSMIFVAQLGDARSPREVWKAWGTAEAINVIADRGLSNEFASVGTSDLMPSFAFIAPEIRVAIVSLAHLPDAVAVSDRLVKPAIAALKT